MRTKGQIISAWRLRRGLSQKELGDRAGTSRQNIANLERDEVGNPHYLAALARVMGYPRVEDLMALQDPPDLKLVAADGTVVFVDIKKPGASSALRPTPVLGMARLGEDGYYEQLSAPDGWVDGYASADTHAYALRVRGDSMHPAIRHGSFVVVEPHGACVVGEYVAIALRDGRKMVKELVIERPDEIVVESVNGNHRRTIDRADIEALHPVAAVVAASKWRPL